MGSRLRIAAVGVAAAMAATAGGIGFLAPAAQAAPTTVTFSITQGALTISVPSTASLNSAVAGAASTYGSLGNTTVSDGRGQVLVGWSVTVSNPTLFTTGASPTSNETVANDHVYYCSGTATGSGLGAFVPTGLSGNLCTTTVGAQVTTGVTGASWTQVSGINSQTWNPTLLVSFISSQASGNYSGTVGQSVA